VLVQLQEEEQPGRARIARASGTPTNTRAGNTQVTFSQGSGTIYNLAFIAISLINYRRLAK
jgi:hypothetical protein